MWSDRDSPGRSLGVVMRGTRLISLENQMTRESELTALRVRGGAQKQAAVVSGL